MTATYTVAFVADEQDLAGGVPAAQVTYLALKETGGEEYERVREAIMRLIAAPPYLEHTDDPDLAGGPSSGWARRHLYRFDCVGKIPAESAAFTIWIGTPTRRWWLTWSRDPRRTDRVLIYALTPAPGGN